MVWGLPLALLLMLTDPLRVPVAVGANFTLIEQLAPADTLLPQVLVSEKSPALVPAMLMPVMARVPTPVLVRVTL
jgi:hypothetical protein